MYQQLLIEKRYEEAIAYLDEHASSFIDLSYVYDQKGRLYHLLGNLSQAINFLTQAYLLDEDEVTLEELGNCYLEDEQYEKAKECFERVDTLDSKYQLVIVYMALQQFDLAIKLLNQLEEDHWVNVNLMICYEMIGKDKQAIQYGLKGLDDLEVISEMIMIYERLEDHIQQRKMIDLLMEQDRNSGLYQLGRYYNHLENYEEAISTFLEIEEPFYDALKALTYAYVKNNQRKDAYEVACRMYEYTKDKDDLEELIEIGSIASIQELSVYFSEYITQYGKDAFILSKIIRYAIEFDLEKAKEVIEEYKEQYEIDDAFLLLENQYLTKIHLSISQNQKKILALRGVNLYYPLWHNTSTPLPYEHIERIYEFSEGLAYIENKDYGGFIDMEGKLVIDFRLEKDTTNRMDSYMYHHHKVFIKEKDGYCILDQKGNKLEEHIDEIHFTSTDLYYTKENYSVINGVKIPYLTHNIKENRIVFESNGKYGYLDEHYFVVIPAIYEEAEDFHQGYALVKQNGLVGYIDINGHQVVDFLYEKGQKVYGNQVVVKNGKYGVIDLNGNIILDFIYDKINDDEKYYYLCINQKWSVASHQGKLLIDFIYDEILYFWNGAARVKVNDYYGMIDELGNIIIPIVFDHVTYAKSGMTIVGIGGRFGYMSLQGELLTPIEFTTATLTGTKGLMNVGIEENFYIIKEEQIWENLLLDKKYSGS